MKLLTPLPKLNPLFQKHCHHSRLQFNSKCIKVEKAENKPNDFSEVNVLRPTSPIFSNPLTVENYQSKLPIGSAKESYSEMVNLSPNSSNTLISTDSIAESIRLYEFNRFVKNGKATMFNLLRLCSGTSSHQMLRYLDVHLEGRQINIAIIHVRINNILRNSKQPVK